MIRQFDCLFYEKHQQYIVTTRYFGDQMFYHKSFPKETHFTLSPKYKTRYCLSVNGQNKSKSADGLAAVKVDHIGIL